MKKNVFFTFVILSIFLTGVLDNSRLISRIKISLSTTERDITDPNFKVELTGLPTEEPIATDICILVPKLRTITKFPTLDQSFVSNPSLNTLYLAHSPPQFA